MASVQKITGKNGEYWKVQVRIKGHPLKSESFRDYETAFIWGKYQEMIIKEKESFNIRPKDIYTVHDVIITKFGENSRELNDCQYFFSKCDIWNLYICDLSYNKLMECANQMLNTPIFRGGCKKNNTGIKKFPAIMTVLRKFAYLSSAINYMVKLGANLDNHCLKVVAWLRDLDEKKKNGKTKRSILQ